MSDADIVTAAAQIVDPRRGLKPFPGTFDEAIDAMVAYANLRTRDNLTEALRNSDPDRVAEICAGALLRLAGEVR